MRTIERLERRDLLAAQTADFAVALQQTGFEQAIVMQDFQLPAGSVVTGVRIDWTFHTINIDDAVITVGSPSTVIEQFANVGSVGIGDSIDIQQTVAERTLSLPDESTYDEVTIWDQSVNGSLDVPPELWAEVSGGDTFTLDVGADGTLLWAFSGGTAVFDVVTTSEAEISGQAVIEYDEPAVATTFTEAVSKGKAKRLARLAGLSGSVKFGDVLA